jgi:hypothetical protein
MIALTVSLARDITIGTSVIGHDEASRLLEGFWSGCASQSSRGAVGRGTKAELNSTPGPFTGMATGVVQKAAVRFWLAESRNLAMPREKPCIPALGEESRKSGCGLGGDYHEHLGADPLSGLLNPFPCRRHGSFRAPRHCPLIVSRQALRPPQVSDSTGSSRFRYGRRKGRRGIWQRLGQLKRMQGCGGHRASPRSPPAHLLPLRTLPQDQG